MNFSPYVGFLLFRILIPGLILVFEATLYLRFIRWAKVVHPERRWVRTTARILFVLFGVALLAVLWLRPRFGDITPSFRFGLVYPFYIWHGSCLFIGLLLAIASLIKLPFKVVLWLAKLLPPVRRTWHKFIDRPGVARFDASRRRFLQRSTAGLAVLSFGGTVYGAYAGRSSYDITEATFPIAGLAPQFDGFTIALISDIHSSLFMTRDEMDEYVRIVNSLGADMVVVPGDFVNSNTAEVYPFAESFSGLHAPQGVYGVMGNHDFYTQEPDVVAREVNACGVRVLRDEGLMIRKDGAQLYLAGIDDTGGGDSARGKMRTALRTAPALTPRVLLCHRPYFVRQAAEEVIDVVLCGHTHGGQVVLGRFGGVAITPASLVSPYVAGKYRFGPTHMYVSRGIGTVGLPLRINCPPEITRIVLRTGPVKTPS